MTWMADAFMPATTAMPGPSTGSSDDRWVMSEVKGIDNREIKRERGAIPVGSGFWVAIRKMPVKTPDDRGHSGISPVRKGCTMQGSSGKPLYRKGSNPPNSTLKYLKYGYSRFLYEL
jgi:hypothetical protein